MQTHGGGAEAPPAVAEWDVTGAAERRGALRLEGGAGTGLCGMVERGGGARWLS